ncbi:DUF6268 family outer membrane beta-barrel protein [Ancylomarina longa]|nr:DUF6268 family outer membrane beta-barrel protein [Ancylomarina longa]
MIKSHFAFALLFLINISVFGQEVEEREVSDWNPDIIGSSVIRGIEFSYHVNTDYAISSKSDLYGDGSGKIDKNRIFKTKLRFPILLKNKLKLAGSFEYSDEEFKFQNIGDNNYPLYRSLNDKNLKSIGGSIYLLSQLKRNMYFMFRFNGKLKGDYWQEHLEEVGKYTFLKMEITPVIGWKVNPNKSWGVGIAYSYTFGDPLIFPVLQYNQNFSKKWGVEAFLPARIKIRYHPSDLFFVSAKAKLTGGSYSIHLDDSSLEDFKTLELRRADVNFSLELEKGITDWLWVSFDAGYRANINFDVTNKNHVFGFSGNKLSSQQNIINSNANGGSFFNFSLFIVPSKTILKKFGLN